MCMDFYVIFVFCVFDLLILTHAHVTFYYLFVPMHLTIGMFVYILFVCVHELAYAHVMCLSAQGAYVKASVSLSCVSTLGGLSACM